VILGASSRFGEASAIELARAGMNIFGVHLDRRDRLPAVEELHAKLRSEPSDFRIVPTSSSRSISR
jgi:enoyl-[acyl-carrier protein] reductase III